MMATSRVEDNADPRYTPGVVLHNLVALMSKLFCARPLAVALVVLASCLLAPSPGVSESKPEAEGPPQLHLNSALGLRAVPIGLTLGNDLGARWSLFESERRLLQDTWVEPGITTELTPAYGWAGAYVTAVPVAVFKLHASFQSLHYFGAFGYLHVPENQAEPDWRLDSFDDDAGDGTGARGWMTTVRARPRIKAGPFVAFVEGEFRWIDMEVDGAYYESTFDMLLRPEDGYASVVPTAGWVFEFPKVSSWLLAGAAWEHLETLEDGLSRDMARVLMLWNLPAEIGGGTPEIAVLGGHWVDHPTRAGTWFLAGQFSVDWML